MRLTEKIGLVLIFSFLAFGLWLGHFRQDGYVSWFAGEHGILEWLTLASIACGFIACLYRVSILKPFRKTSFVSGLYISAALIFLFGVIESSRRWGLVSDFVSGWFVAFLFFSYLTILPLCYLKYPKVRRRVNDWAIPLPRVYHINSYALLLLVYFFMPAIEQSAQLLQFGACWLFFMVMMEPLNRLVFSRKTLDR